MDAARDGSRETEKGTTAMKWPLFGSAVSHLSLFIFLFLFMGDASGRGNPGPIQVVLVEGEGISVMKKTGSGHDEAATLKHENLSEPLQDSVLSDPSPAAPFSLPARISIPESSAAKAQDEKPAAATGGRPGDPAPGEEYSVVRNGYAGSAGNEDFPDRRFQGADRAVSGIGRRPAAGGDAGEGPETRRLREKIEALITYPEDAIRRGREGEVLLRIRVGEGGIPREVRIARSSGTAALDEAARTGVSRASPLPSRPGWFEVPVRFHLR